MTSYKKLKEFGEKLKNSEHQYLSLEQMNTMLRDSLNVHRPETLKHYLKTLEESGFIKTTLINGAPRFEIIKGK